MNRRNFVAGTTVALAAGAAQSQASKPVGSSLPKIPRPVLPYSKDALAPVISEKQLQAHHGLHHVGYYDRLVNLLPQFELADLTLDQAIRRDLADGEQPENIVLRFDPAGGVPMLVACLWSRWVGEGGEELLSFAAITDEPPEEVSAAGHDRCIVPIKASAIDAWLGPDRGDVAAQYAILDDRERPYYEHKLAA